MFARHFLLGLVACFAVSANSVRAKDAVLAFTEELWSVMPRTAHVRELAHGFTWSEGPAWDQVRNRLYFSDVPDNKAYVWSQKNGLETFMSPSGLQSNNPAGFREPGSNGLLVTSDGRLLIANHGARAVELMNIENGLRETVADQYNGKRLNSPNDIAIARDGSLFFTDPPYGLEGLDASPLKEQRQNGVYEVWGDGTVRLIDGSLTFPNGIALSPDEQTLYVAVSDPGAPKIYGYQRDGNAFRNRTVFFDAGPYLERGWPGLPDGMAVAKSGHVFATGPGGVFILSPQGIILGMIRLESATANCAFGLDGSTLFITSGERLLSITTLMTGAAWPND